MSTTGPTPPPTDWSAVIAAQEANDELRAKPNTGVHKSILDREYQPWEQLDPCEVMGIPKTTRTSNVRIRDWNDEDQVDPAVEFGIVPPPMPDILDALDLMERNIPTPAPVVAGMLRRGEKAVLGGASKSFKSWAAIDLCLSVAFGKPWLGRETTQGKVLLVNLELQPWTMRKRLADVASARGIQLERGRLLVWNLRGRKTVADELVSKLKEFTEELALIVIDPAYKLLDGRDENSAADVAGLLNHFEQIAHDTGAAVLIPCHFAKGSASAKEQQDRISGSGVFARDPDGIFTLTRHEEESCFVLESTLRTFAPAPPAVLRWQHPVFSVDDSLDPSKLKQAKSGPKTVFGKDKVLALLPRVGATKTEWRKLVMATMDMSKTTFYDTTDRLVDSGKVERQGDLFVPVSPTSSLPYVD